MGCFSHNGFATAEGGPDGSKTQSRLNNVMDIENHAMIRAILLRGFMQSWWEGFNRNQKQPPPHKCSGK